MRVPLPCAALLLLVAAAPAAAETRLAFRLGAGVGSTPTYWGSAETEIGPAFSLSEGYLSFGSLAFGSADPSEVTTGLGFTGVFRYVPGREPSDAPGLAGTDPIDRTFEVGGGLTYGGGWYEAFATARVGVGGHSEVAGELGMDLIARPTDRLELRAGPRLALGTDGYAATFFDAPGFQAAGGVLSSGVEVGATYDLTDAWGLSATATYERLQNDAAESPVSLEDDQVSATLELTRRFDFRF